MFMLRDLSLYLHLFIYQEDQRGDRRGQGDIDRRACRPAEFFRNGIKYDNGRVVRAYEEHIRRFFDGDSHKGIDDKGDEATTEEELYHVRKVALFCSRSAREDYVKCEENEGIVPSHRVDSQGNVFKEYSRGLKDTRKTAKQVKAHHESVRRLGDPFIFAQHCERAEIHGQTAHLEGKLAPADAAVLNDVEKKYLLEDLAKDKDSREGQ